MAVGGADRAEFGDVEARVAAEQRVVRPGGVIQSLAANHLPLRAFERKADARAAAVGVDAHHVRAVFGARAVGRFLQPGEAEDEADDFFLFERAQHKPAIMDGGDKQVHGDDVRFGAGPDYALKFLHQAQGFGRFEQADVG